MPHGGKVNAGIGTSFDCRHREEGRYEHGLFLKQIGEVLLAGALFRPETGSCALGCDERSACREQASYESSQSLWTA
jgi:hypothetical protein